MQRKAQKDAADLQLRQEEQKRKLVKDVADAKIEEERLNLEKMELGIDAQKAGVKMRADRRAARNKTDMEVAKLVSDIAKE